MAAAWTPSRYSRLRVTEGPVIWGAQIKRELTIPVLVCAERFLPARHGPCAFRVRPSNCTATPL